MYGPSHIVGVPPFNAMTNDGAGYEPSRKVGALPFSVMTNDVAGVPPTGAEMSRGVKFGFRPLGPPHLNVEGRHQSSEGHPTDIERTSSGIR